MEREEQEGPAGPGPWILCVGCPARSGIVAAVASFLAGRGCYLSEMAQFDDESSQRFFMRAVFRFDDGTGDGIDALRRDFGQVAERFDMDWSLHDTARAPRVLLMVSRHDHCLADLLYRRQKGELRMDITAVVSNHGDLRAMAEREGLRFVHLPVTRETKDRQEAELWRIVQETGTELVVLARYMQILSDDLCRKLAGRAINIHHSFLPGFKGARPYHQAWARGVKLIGATAHYVTPELDEGPIIEQAVTRVDHACLPERLASLGRDMETVTLSRAVRWHLERRVFLNGDRTVVFH